MKGDFLDIGNQQKLYRYLKAVMGVIAYNKKSNLASSSKAVFRILARKQAPF